MRSSGQGNSWPHMERPGERELAWMPTQRDSTDATGRNRLIAIVVIRQPVGAIKFNDIRYPRTASGVLVKSNEYHSGEQAI